MAPIHAMKLAPLLPVLIGPMVMRHSVLSAIVLGITSVALWFAVCDVPHEPIRLHRAGGVAAVLAPRARRQLFVGAMHGNRPQGAPLPESEREQAGHALENVGEALSIAGFGWRDVVRLRVHVTSALAGSAYRSARESALGEGGILLAPSRRRASRCSGLDVAETISVVSERPAARHDTFCARMGVERAGHTSEHAQPRRV